ncbi:MAG: hypothetical protein CBE03_010730 [Gammaproteobacteria bacterium TMED243]|nr:hypothetical protein [Gammaproteobacteria bacterium]RPG30198.1 MAG: hypothetical protein CBE03_010730 [Gammaproteobacteria bacterium TMED243]
MVALWLKTKSGALTPIDGLAGSGKRVWWFCENGHEVQNAVADNIRKRRCLFCPGVGRNKTYRQP